VIVEVRLPQWGMGMTEGTVVEWLKSVGDQVAEGEPLVEIETAKAVDVLPAPASGTLVEIVAPADAVIPVNELLAVIETEPSEQDAS
jgi:pyruvate/2-oxoglutarate dehydrogenase complex dihydrolipoamide acyltransferase (E2) component